MADSLLETAAILGQVNVRKLSCLELQPEPGSSILLLKLQLRTSKVKEELVASLCSLIVGATDEVTAEKLQAVADASGNSLSAPLATLFAKVLSSSPTGIENFTPGPGGSGGGGGGGGAGGGAAAEEAEEEKEEEEEEEEMDLGGGMDMFGDEDAGDGDY